MFPEDKIIEIFSMCDDFSKVFVTTVENHSCAKQASVFEESSSITAPPLVNAGVAAGDIDDDDFPPVERASSLDLFKV